jgi:hypothetical protein
MTGRGTQALAAAAAAAALAVLGACGGEPAFETRSANEIQQALEQAGLAVCSATTVPADELPENTVEQRVLTVAFECGNEGEDAIVSVVAWPDRNARDEAIRRYEAASRPSSQNAGVQLAFGQFTIDVGGSRDEDVTDRVLEALDGLGAA